MSLIKEMLEAAKSKEGKRLRCRDYEGAGGFFVDYVADCFLHLAHSNSVSDEEIAREMLKMRCHTRCIDVREHIRKLSDKYENDIDTKFFMTADIAEARFEDDHMNEVAQQIFLEFVYINLAENIADIRGIYWFFKSEKEVVQYQQLKEGGAYQRGLDDGQMAQLKVDIKNRLAYGVAVSDDEELMTKIENWARIEDGQCKLQDNKNRKKLLNNIITAMEVYADKYLQTKEEKITMPECPDKQEDILKHYWENYVQLQCAITGYKSMKAYREKHPINEKEESMLEIGFRQRFGTKMFEM